MTLMAACRSGMFCSSEKHSFQQEGSRTQQCALGQKLNWGIDVIKVGSLVFSWPVFWDTSVAFTY